MKLVKCGVAVTLLACAARVGGAQELTADQWRQDLRFFAEELAVRHADAFHTMTRPQFDAEVARLDTLLPRLPERTRLIELVRLGAKIGDGHTGIFLSSNRGPSGAYRRLPVQFWSHGDTVFIVAATPERGSLAGSVVSHIEGRPVADVLRDLRELVAADNDFGADRNALNYLAIPEVLYATGVAPTADSVRVTVHGAGGRSSVQVLRSIPQSEARALVAHMPTAISRLVFARRFERYWAEALPRQNAVYVQVNTWDIGAGQPELEFRAFADSLGRLLANGSRPRLVLDLRWNSGGRIETARHLLAAILRAPHLEADGKLFAIIGRTTFSAAVLFLLDLERYTGAVFVGEPVAGRPNGFGDLKRFSLPNSKMEVRYSALRMTRADPWDRRPAVLPQIDAPLTLAAYRAGHDPAMAAILGYVPRTPVHRRMLALLDDGDATAALATYRTLRRDSTRAYAFGELELDIVADALIARDRLADAVRVLEANVAEYPHAGWLAFNLGEGHRRLGQTDAAVAAYRRGFLLDRRLGAARDSIRALGR